MPEMVILADDLSGAADCGLMCTEAGLDTLVVLGDPPDVSQDLSQVGAQVWAQVGAQDLSQVGALSIDADTRGLPRDAAVAETVRLTRLHGGPGRLLFRKLDSTLRGHVGAELAAMLRTRREDAPAFILMAPAFPAMGRSTVGGMQLLHGAPLHHSEIWRREGMLHRAHVPEMLQREGLRAAHVALDAVRGAALARDIAAAAAGHDAVVCDAETEADLEAIAAACMPLGRGTIWAGSAGLARHLPKAAGLACPPRPVRVPAADGPILFVVGSLSSVSRGQVARLAAQPGIELVQVPAAVLRAGPRHPGRAVQEARLEEAIGSGRDVVAVLGSVLGSVPGPGLGSGLGSGLSPGLRSGPGSAPGGEDVVSLAEGLALCRALAAMVAPHARRIGALAATGGETARAVLQALGTDGLALVGEVEPGVPLSLATGARRLPVVTKAGAFGRPDTLVHCRAVLRGGLQPPARTGDLPR